VLFERKDVSKLGERGLSKRTVSGITLTLLLMGMLALAFNIQPVKAGGTIYIRADGSVEPDTAPISSVDNITYIFTDNIYDEIVVERDNIVVDGAGYTVQGTGVEYSKGIYLSGRSNVTIKNMKIKAFYHGIKISYSSNIVISGNNITSNNRDGIDLSYSSNNAISGNNIANNRDGILLAAYSSNNLVVENTFVNDGLFVGPTYGNFAVFAVVEGNLVNGKPLVYLEGVSDYAVGEAGQVILVNCTAVTVENLNLSNTTVGVQLWETNNTKISSNNITSNNRDGIWLYSSSNNAISGNNIKSNNECGILLWDSSNNAIFHNNFVNNWAQVHTFKSVNVWDDDYPSGGNYWSDHVCTGNPSDGSQPYIILDDVDHYPFQDPNGWLIPKHGPEAEFTATPDTASTGESIKFDASASVSGWNGTHEMPITEYRWNFGGGINITTSTPIVYYSFISSGIYYVTLTVYAPGATPETDSTTKKVTITAMPVGGYSILIKGYRTTKPLTLYLALIGILTASFTIAKRRKKQQN